VPPFAALPGIGQRVIIVLETGGTFFARLAFTDTAAGSLCLLANKGCPHLPGKSLNPQSAGFRHAASFRALALKPCPRGVFPRDLMRLIVFHLFYGRFCTKHYRAIAFSIRQQFHAGIRSGDNHVCAGIA